MKFFIFYSLMFVIVFLAFQRCLKPNLNRFLLSRDEFELLIFSKMFESIGDQ